MIALTGGNKKVLINKIRILQLQLKWGDFYLLPHDLENMKEIEYLVENNLPVERQKLYEFAPEIFKYEIKDHLDVIKRKRDLMKLRIVQVYL